jgi:heat shock protein HtpX
MLNIYEQVDHNKRRSTLLIIIFIVFIGFTAWAFAQVFDYGWSFIGGALILSGITSFVSYSLSDKIILSISNAHPASKKNNFDFYTTAENLSIAAGIPIPKLYVINDSAMNAFATGRSPEHAVVCVTTGLLDKLNRTELENVVAHELTHITNYDIRLMSLVAVLVGMVTLLADWFLRSSMYGPRSKRKNNSGRSIFLITGLALSLLSPIVAKLIQLALSRRHEYLADAGAVKLTKQPSGLISALQKLDQNKKQLDAANKATTHLYITNPLKNLSGGLNTFSSLFKTHPPIERRINKLQEMI